MNEEKDLSLTRIIHYNQFALVLSLDREEVSCGHIKQLIDATYIQYHSGIALLKNHHRDRTVLQADKMLSQMNSVKALITRT